MSGISAQTIRIGVLEEPLLRNTVSSKHDITRLEKIAHANPTNMPCILVGTFDGKCYPMGRFDVLTACQAAGMQDVKADVRNYDTKLDLITDQMRETTVGEYNDPLRIRHVIDTFGKYGIKADAMLDTVNLAETPAARVALSFITDEVLKALSDFVNDELSDKLPAANLVVPTHIILRIAKMEPEMQSIIAKRVTELTIPQMDMNFGWPTALCIAYEIKNMPKLEKKGDAVVVKVDEMDDVAAGGTEACNTEACNTEACNTEAGNTEAGGTEAGSAKPKANTKDTKTQEKHAKAIEDLKVASQGCMIVLNEEGKPDLLVDKYNDTAKKISEADGGRAFKLHADSARPAFMIPIKTTRHLALDSRPMHGRDFDDAKSLAEFCMTLKDPGLRATVFWTTQ